MLPVMLDLTDQLAVVVGGGAVGRRKAETLLAANAMVRVVCLQPRAADLPDRVEWIAEPYRRVHLTDARLVVAAATAEVNRLVVADARALGVWVGSATEPESGDLILPATARRGRLTLAVSTQGAAPMLARRLAQHLLEPFDDAVADWLDLLAELRPLVLARVADPEQRRRLLNNWSDLGNLQRFRREGRDMLRAALLVEVEALAPSSGRPV
jgi:precorrin-2 dehydrogenase/sirohydrochlorin ferrochelatase